MCVGGWGEREREGGREIWEGDKVLVIECVEPRQQQQQRQASSSPSAAAIAAIAAATTNLCFLRARRKRPNQR